LRGTYPYSGEVFVKTLSCLFLQKSSQVKLAQAYIVGRVFQHKGGILVVVVDARKNTLKEPGVVLFMYAVSIAYWFQRDVS